MQDFILIIIVLIILVVLFWGVSSLFSVFGGINFVKTDPEIIRQIFKEVNFKKGQIFIEPGSGNGSGLIVAAKEFGAKAIGIEISPFLWLISYFKTLNNSNIKIYFGNLNKLNLSKANLVYIYLTPKLVYEIYLKLKKTSKTSCILASRGFAIKDINFFKILNIKNTKIYLYRI